MSDWKTLLTRLAHNADEHFDELKHRLRQRLGGYGPVMLVPYRGYGNEREIYLRGRVLVDKGIGSPHDNQTVWENLLDTYKRFASTEIPWVRVRATIAGQHQEVKTNTEGFFEISLSLAKPLPADRAWHDVELELLDAVNAEQGPVKATGQILVPPPGSRFGVISDIDDTILQTNATSLLKMAKLTFLNNARTRLPFEGVAGFYRALQQGGDNTLFNPIYYVSSSSWNLYDLLTDFCDVQGIPKGPMFLKDLGIDEHQFIKSGHLGHKSGQIKRIMAINDKLPFILIGDSGQKDPEIYRETIRSFPGRVLAVYIRDVSKEAARDEAVQALAYETEKDGVPLLLVPDTLAAVKHAAAQGWVTPETAIPEVRAEKAKDEAAPSDLEQLVGIEPKKSQE